MSSNLNMNKIAASILLAGLIGMVAGKATDFMYGGGEEEAAKTDVKRGYSIEVTEAPEGGAEAAPQGAPDIAPLFASADVKAGGDFVNSKCTVCHNVGKGEGNKIGPHLYGVMGRPVASISDFSYSKGMQTHAGEVKKWDFDALNKFLWNPKKTVPGTLMAFAGIPKDQERANVIAYLNTMTDTPQTPPKPGAAAPAAKDAKAAAPAGAAKAPAKPADTNPASAKANTANTTDKK